jgi:hypothetical protein
MNRVEQQFVVAYIARAEPQEKERISGHRRIRDMPHIASLDASRMRHRHKGPVKWQQRTFTKSQPGISALTNSSLSPEMSTYSRFGETIIVFTHAEVNGEDPTMSGSAAPKHTKDQVSFDPDHEAKTERDEAWIRERFNPNKEEKKKKVAEITGTSSKRRSEEKDPQQGAKVRLDMPCTVR